MLTVLDAAGQTDRIIWNPSEVPADAVYASLPARDLLDLTRTRRFGTPVAVIPAGTATLRGTGGADIHADAVYVSCAGLAQIVGLPPTSAQPCHTAWVTLDALRPHGPATVTLATGGGPVATSIRTGTVRAPVGLVGGSQAVLIPADPATIHRMLTAAADSTVHAVFTLHGRDRVEQLRSLLWRRPSLPFSGAVGPLSTVVSKPDLVADGHRYTEDYARLVLALLVLGSAGALIAAALAGAVDTDEQARRNAVLTALGAPAALARRTVQIGAYLPALTAIGCGLVLGPAVGVAYLDLGDYPQLTGPLHHYPLRNLTTFGGIELVAFALLATPPTCSPPDASAPSRPPPSRESRSAAPPATSLPPGGSPRRGLTEPAAFGGAAPARVSFVRTERSRIRLRPILDSPTTGTVVMAGLDMAQVERLRAAVERASTTVTSPDHTVRVTVGPGGAVTELVLTPQALRRGGNALAGLITGAIREATAELDAALAGALGEFTGGRGDPVGMLSGSLPAADRPAQRPAADDQDWQMPGGELIDRLRDESAHTLDGYAALREELAGMRTTVRSPDGAIAVTVRGTGGAVEAIHIDDAALRHGSTVLAGQVLATLGRARATAALQAARQADALAGAALPVTDMVRSAVPDDLRPDDRNGRDQATGGRR